MESKEMIVSKVDLAENLVAGVQYMSKRGILSDISDKKTLISVCCKDNGLKDKTIEWIKIEQVGVCNDFTSHQYYTAIQKALFSCHRSGKSQLIYMIHGDGEKINIYLGIRKIEEVDLGLGIEDTFTESMSAYLNTLLPGTKTKYIKDIDNIGDKLSNDIKNKKYRHLYTLSGIPSFMSKEGDETFTAIETFLGPLYKKKFVYYVVADPMDENRINDILTKCLEIEGKIESIKSQNISETYNTSVSIGKGNTKTNNYNECVANALSKKGEKNHFGCKLLALIGLGDFVDQSTQTISSGHTKGESISINENDSQGYSATKSITLVNKCADFSAEQISKHIKRFNNGMGLGMWNTGIYLLTDNEFTAQSAAMQLRSIVSGKETSLEPIRIHDLSKLLNKKNVSQDILNALRIFSIPSINLQTDDGAVIKTNFENREEQLTTLLTTEELSCFVNLPQHSIPGVSVVDYSSSFSLTPQKINEQTPMLNLGKLVYSGSESNISVHLPLDTLSRHALVCGVNGSGKTNTVLSVLDGFLKAQRPFLVIEPAKTEYVDWAIKYNETADEDKKIKIFIPGCERYSKTGFTPQKLQMNPFEVIKLKTSEMRTLSHIDRLKSSFASAFPMQDILPVIIEHLLYKLYDPILDSDNINKRIVYPTLKNIDDAFITDLMRELGYATENTQNISAALRTRFKSLSYGWKGELFGNKKLTGITWDELFGSPVVVNLSYAGDDQDKAFIMSMLLQFLYEYRIAESELDDFSFNSNKCRHLVVVEEAHRIMGQCGNTESPQYKSGLMFSNFLSEVRAYGQGMMIVDQVPTRLIEDAVKNTNVKIIHKLVASDDSLRIAESIGLTKEQQKIIAKLSVGQAVLAGFNSAEVMSANSSDIYLAQINMMKQ